MKALDAPFSIKISRVDLCSQSVHPQFKPPLHHELTICADWHNGCLVYVTVIDYSENEMRKLTALDANFLYAETDKAPGHVASVQVLQLPEGVTPSEFVSSFRQYMGERLHLVSYFEDKLEFIPGNLDHPVLVKEKDVDLEQHVVEYPVRKPGSRAELEQAIAEIHEIKLDWNAPLWTTYVLTGLEGGRVATCHKVHHATIDGMSGQSAMTTIMDETPEHPPVPAADDITVEEDCGPLKLLEDSVSNFMRFQAEAGSRWLNAMDANRRLFQRMIDPSKDFGATGRVAPKTPFNRTITEKRTWAADEMPLADLKKIGKAVNATLNDVFMAVCAGGMRTYLERHGALPEQELIAGCPVSLRKPGDTTMGTQVTMMNVGLATSIEDPLERLLAIRESAHTAKEVTAELGGLNESNAAFPGMPAMLSGGLAAFESYGLADWMQGPVNVVISNVPGPRNTLYANGAEMLTHYPVSIPAHGAGVNITVQSYTDKMYVGITACAKALPDAGELRDDMHAAFIELKARLVPAKIGELKRPEAKPEPAPVVGATPEQENQAA